VKRHYHQKKYLISRWMRPAAAGAIHFHVMKQKYLPMRDGIAGETAVAIASSHLP
jgi:hypothetical protein